MLGGDFYFPFPGFVFAAQRKCYSVLLLFFPFHWCFRLPGSRPPVTPPLNTHGFLWSLRDRGWSRPLRFAWLTSAPFFSWAPTLFFFFFFGDRSFVFVNPFYCCFPLSVDSKLSFLFMRCPFCFPSSWSCFSPPLSCRAFLFAYPTRIPPRHSTGRRLWRDDFFDFSDPHHPPRGSPGVHRDHPWFRFFWCRRPHPINAPCFLFPEATPPDKCFNHSFFFMTLPTPPFKGPTPGAEDNRCWCLKAVTYPTLHHHL